jgi:hypothetical protein
MGFGQSDLQAAIWLKQLGFIPNGCAMIEIGAQQLNDGFLAAIEDIKAAGAAFGVTEPPPPLLRVRERNGIDDALAGAPLSRPFWTWLGLDYACIDIDGSPGSIPLDLNFDEVPAEARGKHQLVTNFGSTEHIANQANAFKVIHDLTAPGGVMLHNLPLQGHFNHGFINYNPKFFWTLARDNGYRELLIDYRRGDAEGFPPHAFVKAGLIQGRKLGERFQGYTAEACAALIVLQKTNSAPYVPPLDMPRGSSTDHAALRERYPSVFTREPRTVQLLRWVRAKAPPWLVRAVRRRLFGISTP